MSQQQSIQIKEMEILLCKMITHNCTTTPRSYSLGCKKKYVKQIHLYENIDNCLFVFIMIISVFWLLFHISSSSLNRQRQAMPSCLVFLLLELVHLFKTFETKRWEFIHFQTKVKLNFQDNKISYFTENEQEFCIVLMLIIHSQRRSCSQIETPWTFRFNHRHKCSTKCALYIVLAGSHN